MPHVDEGTLHALLDGALRAEEPDTADAVEAHLASCVDCAARVEAAATLRDSAGAILGALRPAAVAPDFADVLARHETPAGDGTGLDRPTRRTGAAGLPRRLRTTRRLAWAATLVLALGTGYLMGERFGFPQVGPPTTQAPMSSATDPTAGAESTADAESEAAPSEEEDVERGRAADEAEAVRGTAPRDEFATEAPAAADPTPPAAGAGLGGDAATTPVPAPTAPVERFQSLAGEPLEPETGGTGREDVPQALAADQAAALDEIAVTGAPARAAGPRRSAAMAAPPAEVWRPVELAEARALLAGPLLVLPDAEIREAFAAAGATGALSVRTTQVLPGGVSVEVVQVAVEEARARLEEAQGRLESQAAAALGARAAAAPAASQAKGVAEAEAASPATVTVDRDGFRLVLTGPLPAEALRALGLAAAGR